MLRPDIDYIMRASKGNCFILKDQQYWQKTELARPQPAPHNKSPRPVVIRVGIACDKDQSRSQVESVLHHWLKENKKTIGKWTNMDLDRVVIQKANDRSTGFEAWYYLTSNHGFGFLSMQKIRDSILPNVNRLFAFTQSIELLINQKVKEKVLLKQVPWLVTIEGRSEGLHS